eukprot:Nitzschia sp. Nitz4//scaffold296_size27349//5180//7420//NITZ4_008197-RA/size27349-processed-gene-0.17-mRNA-1//1//CDS//3329546264//5673//frame0
MVDRQDDVEVASDSIAVGQNPMIAMLEQKIRDNIPENGLPGTVEVEGPVTSGVTIQPLKDESTPVTASQSPASNKSPQRGMLRAVSSITITDLEAFEKELSAPPIANPKSATETKLSPEKPSTTTGPSPTGVEATSPPQTMPRRLSKEMFDELPLAPIRSPSGLGKFRSKSASATPVVKQSPILPLPSVDSMEKQGSDDDLMEFMQPLSDASGPSLVRRKSLDFVPNVPQRTSSATKFAGMEDSDSVPNSEEDDAEIELLIKALEAQNGGQVFKPEETGGGAGGKMRQRKSLDLVPLVPRRPSQHDDDEDDDDDDDDHHLSVKRTSAHSFDRFESTPMMPLHATRPIPPMNGSCKPPIDSDSDADYSPFQAKDVVVSLEDLENKKAGLQQPQEYPVGHRPVRRKSFDLLPMPPRRFMDENGDDNMPDFESPRRSSCPEAPRFPSLANRRISTDSEGSHSEHFLDTESVDLDGEVSNVMGGDGFPMVRATSAESVPYGPRRRSNIETNADMKAALEVSKDMIRRRSFDILPSLPLRSGSGKSRFKKKKNPNFDDDARPSTQNESFHLPLPTHNVDPFNVEGTVRVLAQRRKSFDFVPNIPSREPYLSDNDLLSDDDFHFNTDDESNVETATENESEAKSELVSKPDSVSDHQKVEAKEPMDKIAEGAGGEVESHSLGMPLTEIEHDRELEVKLVDAAPVSMAEDAPTGDKETTLSQGEEALENGTTVDKELASGECLTTSEPNLVST